jgi:putative sugar O-methyltransferase
VSGVNFWRGGHERNIDREGFRGHEQYIGQHGYPYRAMVEHVRSTPRAGWIERLGEDGAFGCPTEVVDGLTVSRDLLDSIVEIGFLQDAGVELRNARVLDIGAGYGRLAHRLVQAIGDCSVWCVDAIAVSTEVCARYIRHHDLAPRAVTIDSKTLTDLVNPGRTDLAVNVHSWSECSIVEVRGWLDVLGDLGVRRLFHIPHFASLGCHDPVRGSGNGESYRPDLEARGWQLVKEWGGPACSPRVYMLWERP